MSNEENLLTSTKVALGEGLLRKLQAKTFCIVGCGAVGSAFAEMLCRTGAKTIYLIDGDCAEHKNLNRLAGMTADDIGKYKVESLKKYLLNINPLINIIVEGRHLRELYPTDPHGQTARDMIVKSDFVVIAMDDNRSRIVCEKLCEEAPSSLDYLSIGVEIVPDRKKVCFECTWKPETPKEPEGQRRAEGYGEGNGSFMSIITESVSVGFHMMLHHMNNPKSQEFKHYYKVYNDFLPTLVELGGRSLQEQ